MGSGGFLWTQQLKWKVMQGRTISHYTVLERLGGGGMGVVYKALDTRLDRYVALKFLSPELHRDENSKKRFIHEARAASALDHQNICTIYEIGEADDGSMFIAMAFYQGESLKKKMQGNSQLGLRSVIDIALQIAAGLSKAHSMNIIHRDIKPANIMIAADGTIKIVDFGLAKLTGQTELTRSGSALGTAAYMSPEQAQGLAVDYRSDLWSWAVVVYEMLTGELPFRGDNHLSLFYSIVKEEPRAVSSVRNELSPTFDRLMTKALSKDPAKRHSSILEAAEELQRIYASTEVSIFATKSIFKDVDSKSAVARVEKKQIALLKTQIAGYADLLEHLSTAELQRFLKNIHDEIEKIAIASRGVINDFSGEELTILFGIPSADEHDFIRAAHTALAIHDVIQQAGSQFQSRIGTQLLPQSGIASGAVVIRPSNSTDRKFDLSGTVVQTAAALATHAEPGEIRISEEGRRPVERSFETETCSEIPVKGKTRKLKTYRVVAESIQSRFDAWQKEQLSAYTGRQVELQSLNDQLEAARAGNGRFVAIIGEAGSGKSRLLYEFRRSLDSNSFRILQGGSHLYASDVPYSPFIEVLKEEFQLREQENSEQKVIDHIKMLNPSLMDFVPVYLHLLAIPSSNYPLPKHFQGKELQLAITEALYAFIFSRRDGAVLLLLEDWHSADDASRNILEQLQEMIPAYPILIVATCRPECSFRAAEHHTVLYLKALDNASAKTVMQSALNADSIPPDLVDLIFERTAGNPFFIEEICQTLREEGLVKVENRNAIPTQTLERFRLPDTIQSVIGSRLDRLGPEARTVLETASVIGREFHRSLLQKLVQDETDLLRSLEVLKGLGLIQQLRVLPEATYKFKHPLTQETAYEALIAHERKKIHGNVGDAMETLYADRLEENLDVLAHHFGIAERWEKAVHYGRESARKARAVGDFGLALRHLERVEEWLSKLPPDETEATKVEILLDQERLCETLGIRERQEQILNSVISELHGNKNPSLLMETYRRLGEVFAVLGRFEEGEEALNKSLQLSAQIADISGERNAHRSKGFLYWNQGRNEEAVASNELALAIDRKRDDREGLARDLLNLAPILRGMGRNAEALECAEEALTYLESDDPVKRATAIHIVANLHRDAGDYERALEYLNKALEISKGHRQVVHFQLTSLAHLYWQLGRREESFQLLKKSVEISRKSGHAEGLAHSLRTIGELLANSDQMNEALPMLEEAASLFQKLKDISSAAAMFGTVGSIHEKMNRSDQAIQAWKSAKELREKMKDQSGSLAALDALGRLSRQQEDIPASIRFYQEALGFAEKPEAKASLLYTLGILEWKRAGYAAAQNYFRDALALFQQIGDLVHSGLMLNSIGVSLKNMGEMEQAVDILTLAVEMNRQTNERLLEGHGLSILGQVFFEMGNLPRAIEVFRSSLGIRKEIGDRKGEGWMAYQLGVAYAAQKADIEASECFAEARRIAEECGEAELLRACENFQLK